MAVPSASEVIQYANTALYLASNALANGSLFSPIIDPELPKKIYMEKKALEWMYDLDPTNDSLPVVSRYVYTLLGKYGTQARQISGGGGGSVTPSTPNITPAPYMFIVSASSFITTGESTKVITAFIGYNLLFVRAGIPQATVNEGGTYYSWQSSTGTFTCVGAADAGELFQIYAI